MELLNKHIEKLTKLCAKYNVSKLYVFGSAISKTVSEEEKQLH